MSVGLIALLDDVAAIAKVAAASLDDVVAQATKAGVKSAGVVIDDAAVTPSYVVGFAAEREIPIVVKIARGSLFNKLVILLPLALALSFFVPSAITPLLMIGGAYLCYEGAEKVYEALVPHAAHAHDSSASPTDAADNETRKVRGAIKTDFILSAEIMAIALANVSDASIWMQAVVLAVVGFGITLAVYLVVGLIVKADDMGIAMATKEGDHVVARWTRGFGRVIVRAMPTLLRTLSVIGTAAMIWVGGGILIHGVSHYGWHAPEETIHHVALSAATMVPFASSAVEWMVTAAGSGLVGLLVGAIMIPVASRIVVPLGAAITSMRSKSTKPSVS